MEMFLKMSKKLNSKFEKRIDKKFTFISTYETESKGHPIIYFRNI